ncbi:hypothetical protein CUMW_225720 [Citrus unshiu]|uniref:Uncharacterized protein n=1 Tax=Citrus unshiu TaxID=55188 RepID=A0A2H5QFT4_CITUN|nr:hypothetical protein CUMW_225720 [Citrus unshiu]
MAKSLTKTPNFPRNKETNQRVSFNNKALFDAPSAIEMQRLCNKLRTLTLSSSRRLLFQSHAPIHRPFHSAPSSKWRLSPLFNYPSSSSSHITRCCSYPSPSLAAAPSLCSFRLPLSFIQVRHVSSRDRKKRRKPVTPVTSKVKKIKMKSYSSYKSRFRTMNDGQVRRWHEGKRHNAHLKMLCILPFVAYIFCCFLFLLSANSVSFSVYIYLHIYAYGQENPETLFVDWIG